VGVAVTDDPEETTGEILVVQHDDRRWWPVAVSVGTSVLSAILAAALSLSISARNAERDREARIELERVQQEQHNSLCAMIAAFDDNYRDEPPASKLGRDNARDIAALRIAEGCPLPIKE
jgi:hypothetical protein